MFIVISHHFCKPERVDAARERIDKNGAGMTSEPGFLYRYRIERAEKPAIVSTLTAWTAEADYQNFRQRRSARGGHDLQAAPSIASRAKLTRSRQPTAKRRRESRSIRAALLRLSS